MQVSLNSISSPKAINSTNNVNFRGNLLGAMLFAKALQEADRDVFVGGPTPSKKPGPIKEKIDLNNKIRLAQKDAKRAYQIAQEAKIEAKEHYMAADWNSHFASCQVELAQKMHDEAKAVYTKGQKNGFEDFTDENGLDVKFNKNEDGKVVGIEETYKGKLYRKTEFSKAGEGKRILITMPEQFNDVSSIYDFSYPFLTIKNGYKKVGEEGEITKSTIFMDRSDSSITLDLDTEIDKHSKKIAQKYRYNHYQPVSYQENVDEHDVFNFGFKEFTQTSSVDKSIEFDKNGKAKEYKSGIKIVGFEEKNVAQKIGFENGEVKTVAIENNGIFTFENGQMVKTERIIPNFEFMRDAHEIFEFTDGKLSSHSFHVEK